MKSLFRYESMQSVNVAVGCTMYSTLHLYTRFAYLVSGTWLVFMRLCYQTIHINRLKFHAIRF